MKYKLPFQSSLAKIEYTHVHFLRTSTYSSKDASGEREIVMRYLNLCKESDAVVICEITVSIRWP